MRSETHSLRIAALSEERSYKANESAKKFGMLEYSRTIRYILKVKVSVLSNNENNIFSIFSRHRYDIEVNCLLYKTNLEKYFDYSSMNDMAVISIELIGQYLNIF